VLGGVPPGAGRDLTGPQAHAAGATSAISNATAVRRAAQNPAFAGGFHQG
jgi:hypothetical protein